MAHCDIKMENVAFNLETKKVTLIDTGDTCKFGERREVSTPHKNVKTGKAVRLIID